MLSLKSLAAFLFTLLAVVAAVAGAPATTTSVTSAAVQHSADHLDKRFFKAWIDRKVINPIIDNQIAPIIRSQVAESVQAAKPDLLKDIPSVFRGTLAEILGVAPIVANEAKCGWLQPLCNAVLRPLDRIVDGIKQRAKVEVDRILQDSTKRCTEAAIRGVKKQLFLDAASKDRLLGKRGLRSWYHGKINHFMANVMAEIRPEVHSIFVDETKRYLAVLPSILHSNLDRFLPESLRPNAGDVGHAHKRGIMDAIRSKVREWQQAVLARIRSTVEDAMVGLEETVMEVIRKATRKAVADKLPFFDEVDATFKQ